MFIIFSSSFLISCTPVSFHPQSQNLGMQGCDWNSLTSLWRHCEALRGHVETRHLDRRLSVEIFPRRRVEWMTNKIRWFCSWRISQVKRCTNYSKSEIWNGISFCFCCSAENSGPEGAETKSPPLSQTFSKKNILKTLKTTTGDLRYQISSKIMQYLPDAWPYRGQLEVNHSHPSSFESSFQRRTSQVLAGGLRGKSHGSEWIHPIDAKNDGLENVSRLGKCISFQLCLCFYLFWWYLCQILGGGIQKFHSNHLTYQSESLPKNGGNLDFNRNLLVHQPKGDLKSKNFQGLPKYLLFRYISVCFEGCLFLAFQSLPTIAKLPVSLNHSKTPNFLIPFISATLRSPCCRPLRTRWRYGGPTPSASPRGAESRLQRLGKNHFNHLSGPEKSVVNAFFCKL